MLLKINREILFPSRSKRGWLSQPPRIAHNTPLCP